MMLPIPFSNPATYPGHSGVDFPQPRGTLFRASGDGVVTSIDYGARPGHTEGCGNKGTPIVLTVPEGTSVVVCGPCGQQILPAPEGP